MIAEEILELVRGRSSPGVLILDRENKILYANGESFRLLKNPQELPPVIRDLCNELRSAQAKGRDTGLASGRNCALLWIDGESLCSLRAFLIGAPAKGSAATHVMVLVEKVTEQRGLNFKRAKTQYGLTDREIEVVALVAQGLPNKEIGSRLFLSEYTIKDHVKNVMRKMSAASRSEIIYMLK